MKRISRALFSVSAMLSLLLFLACGAAWVRSYWRADLFDFMGVHASAGFVSSRGGFRYYRGWSEPESLLHCRTYHTVSKPPITITPNPSNPVNFDSRLLRIFISYGKAGRYSYFDLIVPDWILCVLTALLPMAWFAGFRARGRRKRRLKYGLCLGCGYDLRASSGRCPECGRESGRA